MKPGIALVVLFVSACAGSPADPSSPDGGSATGLLFDPVTRSSLRPGIVLMHGMPGNARQMAGAGQLLAEHGAVAIAIDAPLLGGVDSPSGSALRIGPSRSS